ncbi:hypothetical protein MMC27_007425 [Xylographa pallens]|nr:hypothetical protein [Xylographa pallens]
MFLSFLFPLFYLLFLAQAGRKPRKGNQATLAASRDYTTSAISATNSLLPITGSAPATPDPSSPFSSSDDIVGPSHHSPSDPGPSDPGPSNSGQVAHESGFENHVLCRTSPDLPVLHRPDCVLSAEQISSPIHRGGGLSIPPTASASAFRFSGGHGDCEFYIVAKHVQSIAADGKPMMWEPSQVEWIQMWIHVRMLADRIIQRCVTDHEASVEDLRLANEGKGGAAAIVFNGERLSDRRLQSYSKTPRGLASIKISILVHDGKALAELRREGWSHEDVWTR